MIKNDNKSGIKAVTLKASDFGDVLTPRPRNSNKYDFGFVGIIGGSDHYSGAAKLANVAACACVSGAGVVRLIVPESIKDYVAPFLLESTLFTLPSENGRAIFDEAAMENAVKKLDSVAVGMGMTDSDETRKIVEYLLKNFKGNLIIDADGLNSIKDCPEVLKDTSANVIITPHLGEFSRLIKVSSSVISDDPLRYAKAFAKEYKVKLLLKGPTTIVTDGEEAFLVDRGTAGMATAGSGDVLSGVLAAFSGKGKASLKAVALGAFACGYAAEIASEDICDIAYVASDTARFIKRAICEIYKSSNS